MSAGLTRSSDAVRLLKRKLGEVGRARVSSPEVERTTLTRRRSLPCEGRGSLRPARAADAGYAIADENVLHEGAAKLEALLEAQRGALRVVVPMRNGKVTAKSRSGDT